MKARVTVTLKPSVLDPQGKAIAGALASLGIAGIASVRQGKVFEVELADGDAGEARAALEQACSRLLANTVVENYHVELDEPPVAVAEEPAAPAPVVEAPTAPIPVAAPAFPDPAFPDPAVATEAAAVTAQMPTEGHP